MTTISDSLIQVRTVMRCNTYFVKINGMRWPTCIASEEGPLPVYR